MMRIMQEVESSNIAKIGYADGVLMLEFKRGGLYKYMGVPYQVYEDMLCAESVGKFFHSDINNKYSFERVIADGSGPLGGMQA